MERTTYLVSTRTPDFTGTQNGRGSQMAYTAFTDRESALRFAQSAVEETNAATAGVRAHICTGCKLCEAAR